MNPINSKSVTVSPSNPPTNITTDAVNNCQNTEEVTFPTTFKMR